MKIKTRYKMHTGCIRTPYLNILKKELKRTPQPYELIKSYDYRIVMEPVDGFPHEELDHVNDAKLASREVVSLKLKPTSIIVLPEIIKVRLHRVPVATRSINVRYFRIFGGLRRAAASGNGLTFLENAISELHHQSKVSIAKLLEHWIVIEAKTMRLSPDPSFEKRLKLYCESLKNLNKRINIKCTNEG